MRPWLADDSQEAIGKGRGTVGSGFKQHQPLVVPVHHNDGADQAGGHAPGGLMYVLELVISVCILNLKCLCKSISKIMTSTRL